MRSHLNSIFRLILLVALPLTILLLYPYDFGDYEYLSHILSDQVHLPLFFLVTWVLFSALQYTAGSSLIKISCGVAIAAGAFELVQPLFDRGSSYNDLFLGYLGIFFAWAIWSATSRRLQILSGLSFITVGSCALVPAWQEWLILKDHLAAFPVLSDFTNSSEARLWKPEVGGELGVEGSTTALLNLNDNPALLLVLTKPWGGVRFRTWHRNWEGFGSLQFTVHNFGAPITIYLRVDDDGDCTEYNSRFNKAISLQSGENQVSIPISEIRQTLSGRILNLRLIKRMLIFKGEEPGLVEVAIDDVRLS